MRFILTGIPSRRITDLLFNGRSCFQYFNNFIVHLTQSCLKPVCYFVDYYLSCIRTYVNEVVVANGHSVFDLSSTAVSSTS